MVLYSKPILTGAALAVAVALTAAQRIVAAD
jgi:hypothetical protein